MFAIETYFSLSSLNLKNGHNAPPKRQGVTLQKTWVYVNLVTSFQQFHLNGNFVSVKVFHLKERKDIGNWKGKHQIALCGELALEEAMDLSY